MKKLSLLLLTSMTLITLSACEADKLTETTPAVATAATETNTAATATVIETKANTPTTEATETTATPDTANADTKTATPSTSKAAVDENSGEGIHQANCSRCHGTEVYTRSDRKVTSLDGLGAQVRICDSQLETQLFPEDIEKLTQYLNESFYKF
jgi:cytochrome c553